jgi:hypothetical protein
MKRDNKSPSAKQASEVKGLRKQFFSEEKNQKTFIFFGSRWRGLPVLADKLPRAPEQKSFGSFLQKRTAFFGPCSYELSFRTHTKRVALLDRKRAKTSYRIVFDYLAMFISFHFYLYIGSRLNHFVSCTG